MSPRISYSQVSANCDDQHVDSEAIDLQARDTLSSLSEMGEEGTQLRWGLIQFRLCQEANDSVTQSFIFSLWYCYKHAEHAGKS